jgi:hypothetical protein
MDPLDIPGSIHGSMDVDVPLGSMDVDVTNIHGYPSSAITGEDHVEFSAYSDGENAPYGSDFVAQAVASNGNNYVMFVVEMNHNEGDYFGDSWLERVN